jgi:hypothetical protein
MCIWRSTTIPVSPTWKSCRTKNATPACVSCSTPCASFEASASGRARHDRQWLKLPIPSLRQGAASAQDQASAHQAYTPKTNGKAERFVQTSLREWGQGVRHLRGTRRRTAHLAAPRSGPASTICANWARCSSDKRGLRPAVQLSTRPPGPAALKRWTQSRSVWRSIPPIFAAEPRSMPSQRASSRSTPAAGTSAATQRSRRRRLSGDGRGGPLTFVPG